MYFDIQFFIAVKQIQVKVQSQIMWDQFLCRIEKEGHRTNGKRFKFKKKESESEERKICYHVYGSFGRV